MSVGKGAGYGFGGALGVIFALFAVFIGLPLMCCVGLAMFGALGASIEDATNGPDSVIESTDKGKDDSVSLADSDNGNQVSGENPTDGEPQPLNRQDPAGQGDTGNAPDN